MHEFLAWVTGLIAIVVPGFGVTPEPFYAGYLEVDYVYAAPLSGGRIEAIEVSEGQHVDAGAPLFSLSDSQQQAALKAAEARVAAAKANLANLETGSRSEELAVVRASLDKAVADAALARSTLDRTQKLFDSGLTPQAQLDQAGNALASAEAQVAQLRAQLAVEELPARDAQQQAAEADLVAAEANAQQARDDLADRRIMAGVGGTIEKLFYNDGEVAAAGAPVLSIRPDGALKARFFVPETDRASLVIGGSVAVGCDGCPPNLLASITRVASDPQFTAPIIYSREERTRLVYLVEAVMPTGVTLLPGQPVTVTRSQ